MIKQNCNSRVNIVGGGHKKFPLNKYCNDLISIRCLLITSNIMQQSIFGEHHILFSHTQSFSFSFFPPSLISSKLSFFLFPFPCLWNPFLPFSFHFLFSFLPFFIFSLTFSPVFFFQVSFRLLLSHSSILSFSPSNSFSLCADCYTNQTVHIQYKRSEVITEKRDQYHTFDITQNLFFNQYNKVLFWYNTSTKNL